MIETIVNEKYGYRELKDKPTIAELSDYYANVYADKKLKKSEAKESEDRLWLNTTLHANIAIELKRNNCQTVLDIGCGNFWLFDYLSHNGMKVFGVEPSSKDKHRVVNDIDDVAGQFEAITMLNVLEHVLDPASFIEKAIKHLKPGGLFICQVPNDFNKLQLLTGKPEYWACYPDHINYFNLKSITNLLEDKQISPYNVESDFPMELFIMAGLDYIDDPKVGAHCHQERMEIESSMGYSELKMLYSLYARAGIGRNILTFGRLEQHADNC